MAQAAGMLPLLLLRMRIGVAIRLYQHHSSISCTTVHLVRALTVLDVLTSNSGEP
jgi:hypothetical protein